ncbi:MAG: hypothetical protein KDH15_06285 [Rhodocyclaceae bacterium]|nr:hypothetical protein [Rhodocyclaceae bacterium]
MRPFTKSAASGLALVAASLLLPGCVADATEAHVWQARHVLVHASDGGRVVEALWVRNGLSLIARHRTTQRIGADDLLLDIDRRLVWLRDGTSLQALSLPDLKPIAGRALASGTAAGGIALSADGAVIVAGVRYRLAAGDPAEALAGALAPEVVRDPPRG